MNHREKLNEKHKNDKYIIIGTIAVVVVIGVLMLWLGKLAPNQNDGNNSTSTATSTPISGSVSTTSAKTLALCLAEKKITMYGAAWCTHCRDQKNAFGEAFQYVPYVECPENTSLCLSKKIEAYPTWQKADGTAKDPAGFVPLPELAEWAGCKI